MRPLLAITAPHCASRNLERRLFSRDRRRRLLGAAVAFHLARGGWDGPITVFEPRPLLGAGLAYSTMDPAHRINVPATRMSLLPDEWPEQFADWLHDRPELAADAPAPMGGAG